MLLGISRRNLGTYRHIARYLLVIFSLDGHLDFNPARRTAASPYVICRHASPPHLHGIFHPSWLHYYMDGKLPLQSKRLDCHYDSSSSI